MLTILQNKKDVLIKIMRSTPYTYDKDMEKYGKSYTKFTGNQWNEDWDWDINLLKSENIEKLKQILEDVKCPSEVIEYRINSNI